jgi:beta-glucosidase-like glycosyl hydrolase
MGQHMPALAWGVESLSEVQRVVKALDAACDIFGGDFKPEWVAEAVRNGLIPEERLDLSCRKLLVEKFELGLFDDRRLQDEQYAEQTVGRTEFVDAGLDAQRRCCTLLTNKVNSLPLRPKHLSKKFYVEGLDKNLARSKGLTVVEEASGADIAILRLQAPYEQREGGFEKFFHSGALDFPQADIEHHKHILQTVPTVIFDVYLDRPAILTSDRRCRSHTHQLGYPTACST